MRFNEIEKSTLARIVCIAILSVLIILTCFRPIEITYTIGIDSPLSWVFNYLFKNGLDNGRNIIFPHGPLAFFMYPLQENLITVLLVTAILQFGIICNLFFLTGFHDKKEWLLPLLFSIILLKVLNFKFLVLANISLLYLLHYLHNKAFLKYTGFALTAFAFYIKIHVAFISAIITASFLIIELYRHRKILSFVKDTILLCLFIMLFWVLMFNSFHNFFRYLYGMLNLAADNSAAVSLYPDNNWFYIILFVLSVFLIPFFQRTKNANYFGFLFVLSLFAAWKHGMAREDIHHAHNLFIYALMLMLFFVIFHKRHLPINLIIISIGLLAFYLNLRNLPTYQSSHIELFGINNFYDFVTGFSSIKEKADKTIVNNLVSNRLPQAALEDIGTSKADVYPWDYSIIPANSLNWQPRPVIQSYDSYTSWLDKQNARHFNSDAAPEFIVWDLNRLTKDLNGGSIESIDNRYLLNDEPQTVFRIITNYQPHYKNESFLILKERDYPLKYDSQILGPVTCEWDTWIDIPGEKHDLVRAQTTIKTNFVGKIKSFFYKDEETWIYYKLTTGEVLKYKIVPKNARDGLWVNPFVYKPESPFIYPQTESIMLKNSNKKLMKKKIQISWEIIDFKYEKDSIIYSFFQKTKPLKQHELLNATNTFDEKNYYWSSKDSNNYISNCYQGSTSYLLAPKAFSPTFSLNADTVYSGSILIQSSCWIKGTESGIQFIISIGDQENLLTWHGIDLHEQIINEKGWNHVYNYLRFNSNDDLKETILKVYIWNTSKHDVLIDNFNVNLIAEQ